MEEREEKIDPKEFLADFQQVYKDFNEVLKSGDAGEKFSAIVKMDMLQKAVEELTAVYHKKSKIPPEMLLEAVEKNKEQIASLEEVKKNMAEVEAVVEETKKLMETHSPIDVRKKRKQGRLRLRRFGRRRAK
ncbi:hypothetical protein K0U07_01475 [bacterium]|nr:hypothetical protein [bacterium]